MAAVVVPCDDCTARLLAGRYRRRRRPSMNDRLIIQLIPKIRNQLTEEDRQANAFGVVDFDAVCAAISTSAADRPVLQEIYELHTLWLADIGLAGRRSSVAIADWLDGGFMPMATCCTKIYEQLRYE